MSKESVNSVTGYPGLEVAHPRTTKEFNLVLAASGLNTQAVQR